MIDLKEKERARVGDVRGRGDGKTVSLFVCFWVWGFFFESLTVLSRLHTEHKARYGT